MQRLRECYLEIIACPSCKSGLYQNGTGLRCSGCSEIYSIDEGIPNLLPKNLKKETMHSINHWNNKYGKDSHRLREPLDDPYIVDNINHIDKFWHGSSEGLFLEAGCGTANVSRFFSRKGRRVVGIDFSINALKVAKMACEKENLDFLFICGDIEKPPFKDNIFSFIYAGGSIEHFENTRSAVLELRRILLPRGRITALVPVVSLSTLTYGFLYGNLPAVPGLFQMARFIHHILFKGRFAVYGYEKSFTIRGIRKLFESGNLSNIKTGYYKSFYEIKMFKSKLISDICRKLLVYRPFWPMIFINGEK